MSIINQFKYHTLLSIMLGAVLFSATCVAENEIVVPLSSGDEITIERYPAKGKYLALWLAPEYGFRNGHRALAKLLNEQNIEVWQGDILQSLFMQLGSSSIKKLDGKRAAELLEYAHKTTGKKIILMGNSYAAITVLQGAYQWQQQKHNTPYFIGAVLLSPYAYQNIPPLGQLPEYMPIISATNIPIMIYQAKNSGNIGQFNTLVEKLQQHNNPVYTRLVHQHMGLFYEEELTEEMQQQLKSMQKNITRMIVVLEKHEVPANNFKLNTHSKNKNGIDIYLKKYKGNISPLAINLKDAYGKKVVKNSYKGQVTVINFWATWCPPCVEEIPSLNRLKEKMAGLPFELISINYAEDKKTILDFMEKVQVDFPVLLDQEGNFAQQWNVITYPSTFVIDKNGKIRYGVNAAIEWDSPELIEKLKSLL